MRITQIFITSKTQMIHIWLILSERIPGRYRTCWVCCVCMCQIYWSYCYIVWSNIYSAEANKSGMQIIVCFFAFFKKFLIRCISYFFLKAFNYKRLRCNAIAEGATADLHVKSRMPSPFILFMHMSNFPVIIFIIFELSIKKNLYHII